MVGSYSLRPAVPKVPPIGQITELNAAGGPPASPVSTTAARPQPVERLTSLDAFRGFIMLLLAASGFGIAGFAALPDEAPVWTRPVATADGTRPATAEDAAARQEWWRELAFHFDHPAWRSDFLLTRSEKPAEESVWLRLGVSFWDLIQPAFMFMVGVALPFSLQRRAATGETWSTRCGHAFLRALALVLLGVFLYSKGTTGTKWDFTNVLAQIGLGYFFVYLMSHARWWLQGVFVLLILGGTWWFMQSGYWSLADRPVPTGAYDAAAVNADPLKGEVLGGRFSPWSKNDNAAHFVDQSLLNTLRDPDGAAMQAWRARIQAGDLSWGEWCQMTARRMFFANTERFEFSRGGYQTLNFVPSMATMLIGVMCGGLLIRRLPAGKTLILLLLGGLACLILGRITGTYLCPIVKRIWTPSWALFSSAYVIWMLAAFYLLFDVLPLRKLAFPLVVVGMNSIVMYLMGQLMRPLVQSSVVQPHMTGWLETLLGTDKELDGPLYLLSDDMFGRIILPIAALLVFWLIAWWLYSRKIFVRL
jgi:heparan-alpha-glucosaminide N-acetyltransferase